MVEDQIQDNNVASPCTNVEQNNNDGILECLSFHSYGDDNEVPSSSIVSSRRDDVSSLTAYSIFSKERRRRMKRDNELPSNPAPEDLAIPAIVTLPGKLQHVQAQQHPSCNSGNLTPSVTGKEKSTRRRFIPAWIRDAPTLIKRTALFCSLLLLGAIFLISAITSRARAVEEESSPRASIGLNDIPQPAPAAYPSSSPPATSPSPPNHASGDMDDSPTFAPAFWAESFPQYPKRAPTSSPHSSGTKQTYTRTWSPTLISDIKVTSRSPTLSPRKPDESRQWNTRTYSTSQPVASPSKKNSKKKSKKSSKASMQKISDKKAKSGKKKQKTVKGWTVNLHCTYIR